MKTAAPMCGSTVVPQKHPLTKKEEQQIDKLFQLPSPALKIFLFFSRRFAGKNVTEARGTVIASQCGMTMKAALRWWKYLFTNGWFNYDERLRLHLAIGKIPKKAAAAK